MTKIFPLLITILAFSCTSKFYVAPKMADCNIRGKNSCYLIKNRLDENWLMVPEDIYKFDYEEGYLYRVKVKKIKTKDDFGNVIDAYQLVEILSKEEFKGRQQHPSALKLKKDVLTLYPCSDWAFHDALSFSGENIK